ncbi:MAG: hypothetical protein ABJ032_08115, partial [Paracoccaceae bacterium]
MREDRKALSPSRNQLSVDEVKDAMGQNILARKVALDYLSNDFALGTFSGGTLSTEKKPFSKPVERAKLDPLRYDPKGMMDFLRKSTYELSQSPEKNFDLGRKLE